MASLLVDIIQVSEHDLEVPDKGRLGLFTLRTCEKHAVLLRLEVLLWELLLSVDNALSL